MPVLPKVGRRSSASMSSWKALMDKFLWHPQSHSPFHRSSRSQGQVRVRGEAQCFRYCTAESFFARLIKSSKKAQTRIPKSELGGDT